MQVVYGITSMAFTPELAEDLLNWTRKHWSIENKLHYRRDVTLREDAIRMPQTHQAQVVATLNNFVIALVNYLGFCPAFLPSKIRRNHLFERLATLVNAW